MILNCQYNNISYDYDNDVLIAYPKDVNEKSVVLNMQGKKLFEDNFSFATFWPGKKFC